MNYRKLVSITLLASMMLPQVAMAQSAPSPDPDPLPNQALNEKDPGLVISPLKKGQRAPFTGVLLSPASAANVIVEMETFQEKLQIEVNKVIKQENANCEKKTLDLSAAATADKKILQSSIDEKQRTISNLNVELKKLKDEKESAWSPGVWVGLGTAGGILLTVLTAFAISKATE